MQRLTHDQPFPEPLRGAIIALGNFDGFHLGHQAVVGRAVQWGAHERRPVIVATFDPHPVRHFKPDTPPFRLTTLDQRERMFAAAGADAMLVFNFGAELASTTAGDFVEKILAGRFGAAGVVTGDHVHQSRSADAQLEGTQILYWLVLTSIRFGLSDLDIAEAIQAGLDADPESTGELPPRLRSLADEWQRAFFRALADQISKTVTMLGEAAAATDARISAMIDQDLAELRSRPYLAEYFARAGA